MATHDPYAALRYADFRYVVGGRFIAMLGEMMVSVAIGWELYERTGSALALGLVGLVQVLPIFVFSLPAGQVADRFPRKRVVLVAQLLMIVSAMSLTWISAVRAPIELVYAVLAVIGVARAFNNPASRTLLPLTVPAEIFPNAATWSSSAAQLAMVVGPAIGGFVIAITGMATPVFALNAATALLFAVLISLIAAGNVPGSKRATGLSGLLDGLVFIRDTKVILSAITLDLFAVLLGGAVSLMPIFAKDILQVGPAGLGWLQAAPSVGAIAMAFIVAHLPPFRAAGRVLLLAVTGFGIATIVFGISTSFWISLAALAFLGAMDNISVVIRSTLVLTRTPDEMRGRVSAVEGMFIGASNQLGGFESGMVAAAFGPVAAVVTGGIGTILVVLAMFGLSPELRDLGPLVEPLPEPVKEAKPVA